MKMTKNALKNLIKETVDAAIADFNAGESPATEIINLTPHAVKVQLPTETIDFPPSGTIARVESQTIKKGEVNGIPLSASKYGAVQNLPPESPGKFYIVSALVRLAVPSRVDVGSPGGLVRNSAGVITGCTGFEINS